MQAEKCANATFRLFSEKFLQRHDGRLEIVFVDAACASSSRSFKGF